MNDYRRSYFQFSWFIKWLFIYQAFIQLFQYFNELGHNDDSSDAETFQYDPSWLYQYIFQLFQFNGGTITEILKTALGDYDPVVVPDALAKCTESLITAEKIEPESTYDHESRHYHFRARAYDPFMGRFLQTDPLGYVDSMNLYQAFNMNPFNFTDPMGEETYRIFFGFRQNEQSKDPQGVVHNFPNFNNLAPLAGPGDTYEFIPIGDPRYNVQSINDSLLAQDTQTYFIGHGGVDSQTHRFNQFVLDSNPTTYVNYPYSRVISRNTRVGLFTCGSNQYANTLIDGTPQIVSVDSGISNTSSTNALAESAHNYIENRMRSDNPATVQDQQITEETIKNSANQPFNNSTFRQRDLNGNVYRIDDGDRIETQMTQQNQLQAIRTVGVLLGLFRI